MISGIVRRGWRRPQGATVIVVLGACALGGCSLNSGVGPFIIDPSHYSVYHCKDFAARLDALHTRQKELSELMNKASEGGASGTLIANLSYRTDYENAIGEEQVLRRSAAEKKCDLPPPPATAMAPAPSTPAAYASQPPPVAPPPAAAPQPPAPAATTTVPVFQSDQTIR